VHTRRRELWMQDQTPVEPGGNHYPRAGDKHDLAPRLRSRSAGRRSARFSVMRTTITTAAIPPELMPFLVIDGTASRAFRRQPRLQPGCWQGRSPWWLEWRRGPLAAPSS
jgi:hypothetical protein